MKNYIISKKLQKLHNLVFGLAFDGFRKSKLDNEFSKQRYSQGKTLFKIRIY